MVATIDASGFLKGFGPDFESDIVRGWEWGGEDNDFGKTHSWDVRPYEGGDQPIQTNASVDLQLTQLTLSISERDMEEGELTNTDTRIVFDALIQFEDRRIVVDGIEREYGAEEIRAVIREFNERTR